MPELIDSYKTLAKELIAGGYASQDLVEKIEQLEQTGELGILTGNLTDFQEQKEIIDDIIDTSENAAKIANLNANKVLAKGLTGTTGFTAYDSADKDNEESKAIRILENSEFKNYIGTTGKRNSNIGFSYEAGSIGGLANNASALEIINYYEALLKARSDLESQMTQEELDTSKVYQKIKKILTDNQDAYNNLKASYEEYLPALGKQIENEVNLQVKNLNNYQDLNKYREEYYKIAKDKYNATEDEIDQIFEQSVATTDLGRAYLIASQYAEKFGKNTNDLQKQLGAMSEEDYVIYSQLLSDNNIKNINEFNKKLIEQKILVTENMLNSAATIAKNAMLSEDFNLDSLLKNEQFINYLETIGENQVSLTTKTYEAQFKIVSDFYNGISIMADEFSKTQQAYNYQQVEGTSNQIAGLLKLNEQTLQKLQAYQQEYLENIEAAQNTSSEKTKNELLEQANEVKTQFEQLAADYQASEISIDFDLNINNLKSQIDEALDEIKRLKDQQIKLAIDWSEVDTVNKMVEKASEITNILKNETVKVGDTYQLTAKQADEWFRIYPELAETATATTNGMIALDEKKVKTFIENRETEVDTKINADIQQLESEKEKLVADLAIAEKDLIAAQELSKGKLQLEDISAEYLKDLKTNLTQYFIDLGMDEVGANTAALKTMNLNENEYYEKLGKLSGDSAKELQGNIGDIANEGKKALTFLGSNVKSFFTYLTTDFKGAMETFIDGWITGKSVKQGLLNVWTASGSYEDYKKEQETIVKKTKGNAELVDAKAGNGPSIPIRSGTVTVTVPSEDENGDLVLTEYSFESAAVFENVGEAQLATYEGAVETLKDAIASIDGQIAVLQAFKNMKLDQFVTGEHFDKEAADAFKEQMERYHEINRAIAKQDRLLEKLDTQISRTFGTKRLEKYKEYIDALNNKLSLQKDKENLAKDYLLKADELSLKTAFAGLADVKVDGEFGEIINSDELIDAAYNEYKKYFEWYQAQSEATKEAHEADMEAAEQAYEKRMEAISQYEETIDTIYEMQDAWEETMRAIQDAKLDKITHELEMIITIKNMDQAARDFSKSIVESMGDELTHSKELYELNKKDYEALKDMYDTYANTFGQLNDLLSDQDYQEWGDISAVISEFENLQGEVISSGEALIEFMTYMEELLPNALKAARERFDEFTKQLEHNNSIASVIKELMTLQGLTYKTTEGFNSLQNATQAQLDASLAKAELNKQWMEGLAGELERAEAALVGVNETDAAYDMLKNNRDALLEEYNAAQEAMLSSAKETMELAQEMFTTEIERATYEFEQAVTGGLGFDLLQTKYDNLITNSERYLDTLEKEYGFNKLNRDLEKSLDKANSSYAASLLKSLQDEINQKSKSKNITQAELDILQAKYNITVAQIALEEAQNAKTSMRLVRNSRGTFDYVYTADQSAIDEATQKLEDEQLEYNQLLKDGIKDLTSSLLSAEQEYAKAREEILKDTALTEEEQNEKLKELDEQWRKTREFYVSQIKKYDTEYREFVNKTTGEISADYDEMIQLVTGSFDDLDDATNILIQNQGNAWQTYQDKIHSITQATGTDFDTLNSYLTTIRDNTSEVKDAGVLAVDTMVGKIQEIHDIALAYKGWADEVLNLIEQYEKLAYAIANAAAAAAGTEKKQENEFRMDKVAAYLTAVGIDEEEVTSDVGTAGFYHETGKTIFEADYEKLEGEKGFFSDENKNLIQQGVQAGSGLGILSEEDKKKLQKDLGLNEVELKYIEEYLAGTWEPGKYLLNNPHEITTLATGGYTGEFNDAKLAFLHEKELVLNKYDTENILSAVDMIRKINLDQIYDNLAKQILSSIGLLSEKLNVQTTYTKSGDTLQQQVHVEASFPGVTSAREIEEALNNIINDAAQFISEHRND